MEAALASALRRRNWSRKRISLGLQVGTWDDVGREVIEFFRQRVPA